MRLLKSPDHSKDRLYAYGTYTYFIYFKFSSWKPQRSSCGMILAYHTASRGFESEFWISFFCSLSFPLSFPVFTIEILRDTFYLQRTYQQIDPLIVGTSYYKFSFRHVKNGKFKSSRIISAKLNKLSILKYLFSYWILAWTWTMEEN